MYSTQQSTPFATLQLSNKIQHYLIYIPNSLSGCSDIIQKEKKKKQQNLKFQHFPLFRFQQNKHHNSTIFILNIFFYISFQYLGLSEKPNRESKLTKKKKLSLPPNQLLLCESTGSDSDQPENPLAVESDPTNGPSLRRRSTPFSFLASS